MFKLGKATRRAVLGVVTAAVASATFAPAAISGALEEIKERGTIRVGVLGGEPPWGFTNAKGEPVGVDIDVAELLAADLGVKPEYERVIVTSRIPTLMTNKVDLLIASMGMFPDRAKVVQFTRPYVANVNLVVAGKDKNISDYADLAGMRVAVNRGNVIDIAVTENAPSDTTVLRFDDDASAVQAVLSGQADAVGLAIFPLKMLDQSNPGHNLEKKIVVNNQWTGIATRKGDKEFNEYLNDFLNRIEESGQLNEISQRWLGTDHPEFPTSLPEIPFTTEQ
ncbi:transporter substrate-binding domain-containing protein [Acuticoccus kandeliae]|uniref:transporter substrate-binding domain-containing protein n=1 Tax=Acuticoccus kandeliae TaxID=2073160 RepID=UPI000D3E6644|nr:transporter substrate-binding domain-containing protein [Acuticoccus kandeliae]